MEKTSINQIVEDVVAEFCVWVKELVEQTETISMPSEINKLELRIRHQGRDILANLFGSLVQQAVDRNSQNNRPCPTCGRRRRHKGIRPRHLITSVGQICLEGPYWYCPDCGSGAHSMDTLVDESMTSLMTQLVSLLGTSMASFAKASNVAYQFLGVRISDNTIRRTCLEQGREAIRKPFKPDGVDKGSDVVGSCDGTMINTREDGWRELKAYQYRYDESKYGQAFLENSKRFGRHLRQGAIAINASRAHRLFFVSDAAAWIEKTVAIQLPMAIHIIDIWHAWEHIYEAGRKIYGEGTDRAQSWSGRYKVLLIQAGGLALLKRLKKCRYKDPDRQGAVDKLVGYLQRNWHRMRYDDYVADDYPISSGPMESFCKQLGARLKGPGMRWSTSNVDAMAALTSLWNNDVWEKYWKKTA